MRQRLRAAVESIDFRFVGATGVMLLLVLVVDDGAAVADESTDLEILWSVLLLMGAFLLVLHLVRAVGILFRQARLRRWRPGRASRLCLMFGIGGASLALTPSMAQAAARKVVTVELGPSCEVVYGTAAAELEERFGSLVLERAGESFRAVEDALARHRIRTGLDAHTGPVTESGRDLAALLPEDQPLPATPALYQYVFVRVGDDASRALLKVLEEVEPQAPRLAFLVDASPEDYALARRTLEGAAYRGVFPAGSGFAAFLGVETFPAIVRATSDGTTHVLAGPVTAEELTHHGF